MLDINKTIQNGTAYFALSGRLETTTAPQCEQEIKSSIEGVSVLTLDFKDLDYISSAGLRVLLSVQKIMNKQGEMKVVNVKETVMEILEITGFSEILTIE